MRRALQLAEQGFSTPNPHVGCVIVQAGEIVGEGSSSPAGGPHAEVNAIAAAGGAASGATAYVTLEPCNHQGRTGPCSEALIQAGIAQVFYGATDPNPTAQGGAERLQSAGVAVRGGILVREASKAHRQFLYSHHIGRPFVTVKAGISLDGRTALESGESKWITSEASRLDSHRLRAERGAVLVGRKTAEIDRSQLSVRGLHVSHQPTRIALDPRGVLPKDLPIFDAAARTLRFTTEPSREDDREFSTPRKLLETLFGEGLNGLLIEGGGTTISSFIKADLVDEIVLYISPKLLGNGPTWLQDYGVESLGDAKQFSLVEAKLIQETDDIHDNVRITAFSRNLQNFLTSI